MSEKMRISMPETLVKYYGDEAWHGSIESLLEAKPDKFPEHLKWEEQLNYHEAFLAAQVTRFDYHKAMWGLWQFCWGDGYRKIEKVVGEPKAKWDTFKALAPNVVWDEGLWREYSRDSDTSRYAVLGVDIGNDHLRAGVYVSAGGRKDAVDERALRAILEGIPEDTYEVFEDETVYLTHPSCRLGLKKDDVKAEFDVSGLAEICSGVLGRLAKLK